MALQPSLGPGRCQNFLPVIPIQCPSSPRPNTELPQILLHSIHPSQFRSAYSSTSFRFEYRRVSFFVGFSSSILIICPAQRCLAIFIYLTMSQSVNNEYNSLLYLIRQVPFAFKYVCSLYLRFKGASTSKDIGARN